jgi:hypothetical protein
MTLWIQDDIILLFGMMIKHLWLWSTRLAYFEQHYMFFWVFCVLTHFRMVIQTWFGTPTHPGLEEPNVVEWKWVMGFCTCTIDVQGIPKVLVDKYWDMLWISNFCWVEQVWYAQFFPPTHLYSTFVALTFGSIMLVQGGDILGIYGIMDLWVTRRRFLMWGS